MIYGKPFRVLAVCLALVVVAIGAQATGEKERVRPETEDPVAVKAPEAKPSPMPSFASASIDWRQFSGQTLSVLFTNHPWQEAVDRYLPEFEELTGIKIDYTRLPYQEFLTRVRSAMTAGTFHYDVYMSRYFDAPRRTLEGWTIDLEPLMNNRRVTDPAWFDWSDFFAGQRAIANTGEFLDMLPVTTEVQVLIYRTDVYEQLNLQEPKTLAELLNNARTISEKTDMAGITLRGGAAMYWPFYGVVASHGGEFFENSTVPVINSPQAIAGGEMYVELSKYAPRGITNYSFDEINTAMMAGRAAQYLDSSVAFSRFQDPSKSTIAGKFRIAPFPEGAAGAFPNTFSWSISIPRWSRNPEAAWLLMQFLASKEIMYRTAERGIVCPRDSVWETPVYEVNFPGHYVNAVRESLKGAKSPAVNLRFNEATRLLAGEVQKAMLGHQTARDALNNTQRLWEALEYTVPE